jgi:inward rectifier potassium channel
MFSGDSKSKLVKIFKRQESPEFGFGTTTTEGGQRILNKDGSANIVRLGEPRFSWLNIYHLLITMKWWKFNLVILFYYVTVNLLFTLIYYCFAPDQLAGMVYTNEWEYFQEIFFFSAQSLTTVGYGRINPMGTFASSLASLEAMIGLMGFALATGLLYGRFSRPTAKLLYSDNILVSPYHHPTKSADAPTALMFRVANARNNQLIEVEALVLFAYNEEQNGKLVRRFQRLTLEVEKINFLAMSWTIVHPINQESPIKNLTPEDFKHLDAEFMVSIKAIDDTYVQQIYARTSYKWQEMLWDSKFESILTRNEDGRTAIDLRKLSSYQPVE